VELDIHVGFVKYQYRKKFYESHGLGLRVVFRGVYIILSILCTYKYASLLKTLDYAKYTYVHKESEVLLFPAHVRIYMVRPQKL
jgi:hypothetical protein